MLLHAYIRPIKLIMTPLKRRLSDRGVAFCRDHGADDFILGDFNDNGDAEGIDGGEGIGVFAEDEGRGCVFDAHLVGVWGVGVCGGVS